MDLTWDLESLYPSFDSKKFKGDMEFFQYELDNLNQWAETDLQDRNQTLHQMEEFLQRYNAFKAKYACLYSYAELVLSTDSDNMEAVNMLDEIESMAARASDAFVSFSQWLVKIDSLEEIISASEYLAEHRFHLQELRVQAKYVLNEEIEAVIARMQSTGSKAWERLYMRSISTLSMELEGEGESRRLSLAELRSRAYNVNAAVRKEAYEAEHQLYKSIAELSAACINGISGEAITIYGLRGYASPLDKVLAASKMDHSTLDAMMEAIRENLPLFQTYYRKKAEILGHASGLPFYDVFAPVGGGSAKLTYNEAKEGIITGFDTFSAELGNFARKVFDSRWIDAEPRPGKGSYGMCVDIFPIRESRIMANFNGNYMDMSVLAHEIGHAYHSSCLACETMVNTDYPIPIAETASIFCETIINNQLLKTASASDGLSILERGLSDAGYYIVDFYARYLFESRLYARRSLGVLSVEELNELMLTCMAEAYGNSIDPSTFHPYLWISKAGYYMAGNEFLNFPYSFGLLFSKGLYAQYQKRGQDFVERYQSFLAATSTNHIVDAAKLMDIDVRSVSFWKEALVLIGDEIEDFIRRG
ncbi:pepF/M3 family oligoendopeptidase [Paenibacillus forsythiae]|uniref:PepF/M3 family oligoendopeptidase n=1 Tax=Paenibacillus forsythiae TaxID=365616 RepID=A0ABU3H788_9BACL|nr:M3 family oligoendopeptidase [Paenibacillus forsythiae]MDT3426702.1 pepF/M3 family oligoendopeptidase [Paenibacillus forsythiae]